MTTVWMMPPWGVGEPQQVEATPEKLVPMMVAGWNQCTPSQAGNQEETPNVHD